MPTWVKVLLGAAAVVFVGLLTVAGVLLATSEVGRDTADGPGLVNDGGSNLEVDAPTTAFTGIDCDRLATEAVEASAGQPAGAQLLKVRSPMVAEDNRMAVAPPTGTEDALVLSCTGAGVFQDGTVGDVIIELTVDADGDAFVFYRPVA